MKQIPESTPVDDNPLDGIIKLMDEIKRNTKPSRIPEGSERLNNVEGIIKMIEEEEEG